MPTLNKTYSLTITPEQFLENFSRLELLELDLLLNSKSFRDKMKPEIPNLEIENKTSTTFKSSCKQRVKLFKDEKFIGIQEVILDPNDECEPWLNIDHAGADISLSVSNWDSLVELVEKVKKTSK